MRALLRRLGADETATTLTFADLELDHGHARGGAAGDETLALTRTEFALLELFLRNPKQVLTRSVIFDRVWLRLRLRLELARRLHLVPCGRRPQAGGKPRLIHTVRGVGYALREP